MACINQEKEMAFAEVIFNIPINHAYTYKIPDEVKVLLPGMRVLAPFGKRTMTGMVVKITKESKVTSVKNFLDVLDEKPMVSDEMLKLTKWISEYYFSSWGQAVQLALPRGIDTIETEIVHLIEDEIDEDLTERQQDLYHVIAINPDKTKDYYRKKFGYGSFHYFLNILEEKGYIWREKKKKEARVRELIKKFVHIPRNYEERKNASADFQKYLKRRPEIDDFFIKYCGKAIPLSDFQKLTSMASKTLKKVVSYEICVLEERRMDRKPEYENNEKKKDITLMEEQQKVVSELLKDVKDEKFTAKLLHGVTGSGKTQVYIETLKEVIKLGKTGIILIPEIALTPQTVIRFQSIFSDNVVVFHSKMSPGERYDAWMSCYRQEVKIVVGPRSALFMPIKNIGLIVIDEEHESTYKQKDNQLKYHARDVAVYWAKMNDAIILLGSATPSLESYYNARRGKYGLLEIKNRVENVRMPDVNIVDMKYNRYKVNDQRSLFSEELVQKIRDRIRKKEQVILLQNRRGYSSFIQCKECGFIPVCPNCELTLTYHSYHNKLQCHLCGHMQPAFRHCPQCESVNLSYKGDGTQKIQGELMAIFPDVKIIRMDQDTTQGKNMHHKLLSSFAKKEADILLGTQMIAKGLDFANVTLVGVISTDVGLAIPDYRAAERTFQLLTQVAGRSGRGDLPGEVILQSYMFSHYAIQYAKNHDYLGFYMDEMKFRMDYNYPPFSRMIEVQVSASEIGDAINTVRKLALDIHKAASPFCDVIGPAPAVIPRMKNMHRWQLTIRLNPLSDPGGKRTKAILREIIKPQLFSAKSNVKVSVDVDPIL
jgi:primosomal protein N' (replication factor Y)